MLAPRLVDSTESISAHADPEHILAVIRYAPCAGSPVPPCLTIDLPLRPLETGYSEVWSCEGPVERGEVAGVRLAHNGHTLIGAVACDARTLAQGFESAIADAYGRISQAATAAAFPHFLRMWNYLPDIHRMEGVLNRYQLFCRARYEPLTTHCKGRHDGYPAATAIGTHSDEAVIYFLASRQPGRHLENPRQESAYRYPERYGPQSPSFARATLGEMDSRMWLFVSGTASIVGHESRHRANIVAQCNEVLANIDRLLKTADAQRGLETLSHIKVYLRRADHLAAVRGILEEALPKTDPRLILQGELCRSELLLEIEGLAMRQRT